MTQTPNSYRELDYTFGKMLQDLRNSVGLTQLEFANQLGVSRRTIGDWEAGLKYPRSEHFKKIVVILLGKGAFKPGKEAAEIQNLWQAARQKAIISDNWLTAALTGSAVEAEQSANATEIEFPSSAAPFVPPEETGIAAKPAGPLHDWDEAQVVEQFYGREWEQKLLKTWLVEERCKVVSVLGLGGIGKTTLTVNLMHQVAADFEVVIWRSLRDAPTCAALLDECLQLLLPHLPQFAPGQIDPRLDLLMECLRDRRVLLVLDNAETLLEESVFPSNLRPGFENYRPLLQRAAQTNHASCLLLTSREKLTDLIPFEGNRSPVRVLRLAHLNNEACEQILAEKAVEGTAQDRTRLIDIYAGNPLALKIVSQTIVDGFEGKIGDFLAQGEVIYGGIRDLLAEQFNRLNRLEQLILIWLAIFREPVRLDELLEVLVTPLPKGKVLEALQTLNHHSLIERGQKAGTFSLQSVVLEYLTAQIISKAVAEISQSQLNHLLDFGLALSHARDYVRVSQEKLLLTPILATLQSNWPEAAELKRHLLALLDRLRQYDPQQQNYGPANLLNLFRLLQNNLDNLDMSYLMLREIYLQGTTMRNSSLAEATIHNGIFSETFNSITAVAIPKTGEVWAAASRDGEIRLYARGGQQLLKSWRGHSEMVWTLSFSQDGSVLASGSWDGTVKLWDADDGSLLWTAKHTNHVESVMISPDDTLVASCGIDATVRLWDRQTGEQSQVLPHPVPVIAICWHKDMRYLASGDLEGNIRIWEFQSNKQVVSTLTLSGHSDWVDGLDFAPQGALLASAGWDNTVKIWDIADGELKYDLTGHTDRVGRVMWSPDGKTLASSSRDQTLLLWDVEQARYRATLRGHTSGVTGLAFTPDSLNLLSASEDGTMRIWDAHSSQAVRVVSGYASIFFVVDWQPDGLALASGGTEGIVTVWGTASGQAERELAGHFGFITGLAWSPDGRTLASSEWDNSLRLWDTTTGRCFKEIKHQFEPGHSFFGLSWSPDSKRLAAGTYSRGIEIFRLDEEDKPHRLGPGNFPTPVRAVTFSPDGTLIAGGGDDGTVCLFDAVTKKIVRRLVGHQSMVRSVAWNEDGTRLAAAGSGPDGGELFVWDPLTGKRLANLKGHAANVYAVEWGRRENAHILISGDGEGNLKWWDAATGAAILTRNETGRTIQALRCSPDGLTLVSCGDDGALTLWSLPDGKLLRSIRHPRPYEGLNIRGINGLNETQLANLHALGAISGTEDL